MRWTAAGTATMKHELLAQDFVFMHRLLSSPDPFRLPPLTRRSVLGLAAAATAAFAPRGARADLPLRIVSTDYALAETLIALDHPPVGLGDVPGWAEWVVAPPLPPATVDIGASLDPNLEVVASLKPDLILTTDYTSGVEPQLSRIAPVERITLYAPGLVPIDAARGATLRLGALTGREAQARALIARTDAFWQAGRAALAPYAQTPLLVLSLMDNRHVRVYAPVGLLDSAMRKLGLVNAWTGDGGFWGFETVGIERLSEVGPAQIFLLENVQEDAWEAIRQSTLWQALPAVRHRPVRRLPSVLMFGSLVAAQRFGEALLTAVPEAAS